MLDIDRLQSDVISLPEDVQQTVIDFVSALKKKHQTIVKPASSAPISFKDQPFVGMWSDRLEAKDSTTWVRQLRTQQWGN